MAPAEVGEAAARVAAEAQARRKTIESLEGQLASHKADEWVASHPSGPIAETVEGGMQAAKLLATALVARGRVALIAAREGQRVHLCFSRPAGPGPAMNTVLKSVLLILEGQGGGSAEIAQGSGNASRVTEALTAARQQVTST